jgi:hypothetical protein
LLPITKSAGASARRIRPARLAGGKEGRPAGRKLERRWAAFAKGELEQARAKAEQAVKLAR